MSKLKLLTIILLGFLCYPLSATFAQDIDRDKAVVLYDPLFWKDDLKLSSEQCQKIREINYDFFQQITSLARDQRNVALHKTAEILSERSDKIWNTFQPRQKKKWKKMWSAESES